ncbi:hypothetical protein JCM14469_42910 [Desulfatiferula olefinivorans]
MRLLWEQSPYANTEHHLSIKTLVPDLKPEETTGKAVTCVRKPTGDNPRRTENENESETAPP